MKVCHLTTLHRRGDSRIFLKECRSLAAAGYEVILLVADGHGDDQVGGVRIVDAGQRPRGLFRRFRFSRSVMYNKALELKAELYHFHDPELMPVGLALKRRGARVVMDAHEDLPEQLKVKVWGTPRFNRLLSRYMAWYELHCARRLDAVVAATPHICEKFISGLSGKHGNRGQPWVKLVRNYPLKDELGDPDGKLRTEKQDAATLGHPAKICYVGGLFANRGLREMAEAARQAGLTLVLGGAFAPESLRGPFLATYADAVDYRGVLDRRGVADLLAESAVGLVVLSDLPSYRESLPIKLFEYMSAGLPVVASHFPLWREIVEDGGCGLCVNPADPSAIAAAIRTICEDRDLAARMGRAGRRLVEERYNWEAESLTLLELYRKLEG